MSIQLPPDLDDVLAAQGEGALLDLRDPSKARELLLDDLFLFAWTIFGFRDLKAGLHDEICALLADWGKPGLRRLLIQIPREYYKTSLNRANALWQVCRGFYRGPDDAVVIFNERLENAQKWVRSIRDVVHGSPLFHSLFREMLPPGVISGTMPHRWKWSDTELMFPRNSYGIPEASITASGIEAATTGGHWPTMIIDDPISLKHAQSAPEMERAREWVDKHIYLMRPVEHGRSLVFDTPWAYNDINRDFIQRYDYAVYRRHALEDADGNSDVFAGESIFPEKLDTATLHKMYARDEFGFMAQMQCLPRAGREASLDAKDLRFGEVLHDGDEAWFVIDPQHYDPSITAFEDEQPPPRIVPLHVMTKWLLFDPAPSRETETKKEPRARNGLVLEGLDPWGRRFVLATAALRKDPLDVLGQAFELLADWGSDTISIEEVNFSILYQPFMRYMTQIDARYNRPINFIPFKPGKQDKHTRIRSRFPLFKKGFYYLNRSETKQLVSEALEYPHGDTVDLLDALSQDEAIPRGETGVEQRSRRYRDWKRGSANDEVTGYGPAQGKDPVDG